jgi:hypothetical protein
MSLHRTETPLTLEQLDRIGAITIAVIGIFILGWLIYVWK